MITEIAGFHLSALLFESAEILIFRATREHDRLPVILKVLKPSAATVEKLDRFRLEYDTLASLKIPGVITAYGLERHQNSLLMVLEDIGGESLDRQLRHRRPELDEFLELAVRLTETLGLLHQRKITHQEINPFHIVWNPESGDVRIIDFGKATELPHETIARQNISTFESPLAFISPEQSGRMNRVVDYRTDFYSLGATFYWMLTGRPPFEESDPLALIYSHLARLPVPPRLLNPAIPRPLSDVIMKLLAKVAEDRYQSTHGLVADLRKCNQPDPFPLGEADLSERLQVPQKLYGRQLDIRKLMDAFTRVSQGARELFLLGGYPGVGKTALVHEIHRPITEKRGYFAEGKFDLIQRNIPYSAWIQAFRGLTHQLLMKSPQQLAQWKASAQNAIGGNGKVLTDVIPNLELILGPQPEAPELGAIEAENRFNYLFKAFIKTLAQKEHPLVVFLDDLQWIDTASLNLLQVLMTDSELKHFFLIGAYRDNEVDATHPLMIAAEELRKKDTSQERLILTSLSEQDVNSLLSDTLHQSPSNTLPLARLICSKTSGNAFFTHQTLHSLVDRGLLRFDNRESRWRWDITALQSIEISDNVVELMTRKLMRLPSATRDALMLAACIGNVFDVQTLAVILEEPPREAIQRLWSAMLEGLVVPQDENYKLISVTGLGQSEINSTFKFLHDRVQQAAYNLIPEARREPIHLKIGYRLLAHTPDADLEERIFDIVQQLNKGAALIRAREQRRKLAQLNLLAGKRARNAAAYSSSYRYLHVAIDLQEADSWERDYDLAIESHLKGIELASLTGHYTEMELLFGIVIRKAHSVLDQVEAYRFRIQGCVAQGDLQKALTTSLEILRLLGQDFPADPSPEDIERRLKEVRDAYSGRDIGALLHLRRMSDPGSLAIMRVLAQSFAAAFIGRPPLLPLLTSSAVSLSIRYGNAPESSYAYAVYALILCALGELDTGYAFGKLAVSVMEKLDSREYKSKVLEVVNGHVWHFKQPLRDTLGPLAEGFQSGLETGDLEYAGYNAFFVSCNAYFAGLELPQLERKMAVYHAGIRSFAETARRWQVSFWQATLNLLDRSEDPCLLIGDACDERELLPLLRRTRNHAAMGTLFLNGMILNYLFENHEQANQKAIAARENEDGLKAMAAVPVLYFYESLILLARYSNRPASEHPAILERVDLNLSAFEHWAKHAPMNHLHKLRLMEAERARVMDQGGAARELYDQAISGARKNGYIQEEALAQELAAKFYFEKDLASIAAIYLQQAHSAYSRWGAVAKVNQLEQRYPEYFQGRSASAGATGALARFSPIDAATLVKASQALSQEIHLEQLISAIIRLVIQNSGATLGALIQYENDRFLIQAMGPAQESTCGRQGIPIEDCQDIPHSILLYVARTRRPLVLNDAQREPPFSTDSHLRDTHPKSVVCLPIEFQGKLMGLLYLENSLTADAFTPDRLELLNVLAAQAAISLANSRYFDQLKTANEALKRKTEELNQFFNLSLDLLCIADSDGYFRLINPAWEKTLGYSREELLSRTYLEFVHPEDLVSTKAAMAQLDSQQAVLNFVNRFRRKDGSYRWLEWRSAPAGALIYAAARDITTRVQTEQDLQSAKEAAEAASRVKAQFLDIAAHELRTPLTAFSLLIQHSQKQLQLGKSMAPATLDRLGKQVARLNGLVDDLLDVSRLDRGVMILRKRRTDLNSIVSDTVEDFRVQAKGRHIEFTRPAEPTLLEVDPMRIQQVVGNLLENAFKYTPQSSPIEVRITPLQNAMVRVSVTDHGPGIPQDQQSALFTRFFRSSSDDTIRHPGLGLGLFICKSILELHEGTIHVESELNNGSTFYFDLPMKGR